MRASSQIQLHDGQGTLWSHRPNTAVNANGHVSHFMETSGKTECTTQVMGASSELIQQTCLDIFALIELKPRQAGVETLMRMRGNCLELCGFQKFSIS